MKAAIFGVVSGLSVLASALTEFPRCSADSKAPEFQRAAPGYAWSFPRDHAPHPGFQTEWWYYTGHLFAEGSEPFRDAPLYGFQLTFFRRSDVPGNQSNSEYLAHAALTDIRAGTTTLSIRKGGALLGAAGADPKTLEVWSGDWLAELVNNTQVLRFSPDKQRSVRLIGKVASPPWLQGEQGYSRKGACDSCASHYYSLPRMPLTGEVRTASGITPVVGFGWMDHEFMSNTLQADQVGWDWLGLMMKDGRSLTVFRLRDARGGTSFASASIMSATGSESVIAHDISLAPSDEWRSSRSGAAYPTHWRVQIPSQSIDVVVKARVSDCEIGDGGSDLEPRYWEGPVSSSDESVIGYLEMTGYAGKVEL